MSKYMKSCLLSELLLISLEKAVQIFEIVAEGSGARDAGRAGRQHLALFSCKTQLHDG